MKSFGITLCVIGLSLSLCALLMKTCEPRSSLRTERVCPVDDGRRAKFIIDCAAAANPHSDEEGEDLVHECARQAEELYCTEGRMFVESFDASAAQPCRWAKTPEQKAACE